QGEAVRNREAGYHIGRIHRRAHPAARSGARACRTRGERRIPHARSRTRRRRGQADDIGGPGRTGDRPDSSACRRGISEAAFRGGTVRVDAGPRPRFDSASHRLAGSFRSLGEVSVAPEISITLQDRFARELPEMAVRWQAEATPDGRLLVLNESLATELCLDP